MGYLIVLLPTLLGASLFFLATIISSWSRSSCSVKRGDVILVAGAGGIFGNLLIAALIGWIDRQGMRVFTTEHTYALTAVTGVSLALVVLYLANTRVAPKVCSWSRSDTVQSSKITLLLFILCTCLLSSTLFLSWSQPVSAWDALGHWVGWGKKFLVYDLSSQYFEERSRVAGDPWHWIHPRHPPTVFHMAAFSGYALSGTYLEGWLSPWPIIWICWALVVYGCVDALTENTGLSVCATWAFLAIPLLENHAGLLGYADFWIGAITTASCALIAVSLARGSWWMLTVGVLFSFATLLIKNTGIIYACVILISLLTTLCIGRNKAFWFGVFSLLTVTLVAVLMSEPDFQLLGHQFKFKFGQDGVIIFGGYELPFEAYPVIEILENTVWALLTNQSFSIIPLFLGILSAFVLTKLATESCASSNFHVSINKATFFLLFSANLLILFFMLPQMVTAYAVDFAEPGSDTGNSRFIMPFAAISVLLLSVIPRIAMSDTDTRDALR